jgi:hypothetical protein
MNTIIRKEYILIISLLCISILGFTQTKEELTIDFSGENGENGYVNYNSQVNLDKNGENGKNGNNLQIFLQYGKKHNKDFVYITCKTGVTIYTDTISTMDYLTILSKGGNGGNGGNGFNKNLNNDRYIVKGINKELKLHSNYISYPPRENNYQMIESGNGGDAGNGGNIEVYYDKELTTFLSHLTIDVSPGIPGKYGKSIDFLYRGLRGKEGNPGTIKIATSMTDKELLTNFNFLHPIQ